MPKISEAEQIKMIRTLTEVAVLAAIVTEEPSEAAKKIADHVVETIQTVVKAADVEITKLKKEVEALKAGKKPARTGQEALDSLRAYLASR